MRFIESPVFTASLRRHLDDEQYRAMQAALSLRPEQGALISGGAGLRKLRWGAEGRGKRGGVRTIYFALDETKQQRVIAVERLGRPFRRIEGTTGVRRRRSVAISGRPASRSVGELAHPRSGPSGDGRCDAGACLWLDPTTVDSSGTPAGA
jgi:mRNA-degrading endonuclease RelE of RelBE toxin-antitoxin system